jgi:enoyl-[acyl-carrier protein] reductase I
LNEAAERAPKRHLATIDDVGAYAAFLACKEAFYVTGGIHQIDGGYSLVA